MVLPRDKVLLIIRKRRRYALSAPRLLDGESRRGGNGNEGKLNYSFYSLEADISISLLASKLHSSRDTVRSEHTRFAVRKFLGHRSSFPYRRYQP